MAKEILVVGSKVKAYIASKGLRTSGDAIEAVSLRVNELLDKAIARTKENGRQTVKPYDC